MTPKIDILLPYWGDVELFKETVTSVLAQTDTRWRLLIFDDYYPTLDAQQYIAKINDERITYHRHRENIGITNNFNYAVQSASSKYCVVLGCDDRLLPNYVESALCGIGDASFYQPGVQIINRSGNLYRPLTDRIKQYLRPRRPGIYSGERLAVSLCMGNWLYFPSLVWSTEVLKKYPFNSKYVVVEDLAVELMMISDGHLLALDNTITFQYRRFADSVSSKEKRRSGIRFDEEGAIYSHFVEAFQKIGWMKASRSAKFRITSRINQFISQLL